MQAVNAIMMGGHEVLPLIEGGKGIAVSTGRSSGAWAAAGGVGTVSAVNADTYDENGDKITQVYHGRTRRERHEELIEWGIKGGETQVKRAHDMRGGEGLLNINILWEMGGAERILKGVLERTRGLVHGVTCGAGMPFKLAEIASSFNVHYYPIVSSARAFSLLWKRAYKKFADHLGAVVYEDPWLAGGHNGLSNAESPDRPEDPYPRVLEIRKAMREFGLGHVPIVMAGGVWYLRDWAHWINNDELGPIAFQFGTRPLLTKESEIPSVWKEKLLTLKKGDILLQKFSPTGFYSSAVKNNFIRELVGRSNRQIPFSKEPVGEHQTELSVGQRVRRYFVTAKDRDDALEWIQGGYTEALATPDETLVFVDPAKRDEIRKDQADCMGCLSHCQFSNWADNETNSSGRKADPRSFCIQKTLQEAAHGDDIDNNLMFAGHNAFKFADDPFYSNGFVPTVKQLVERIRSGD